MVTKYSVKENNNLVVNQKLQPVKLVIWQIESSLYWLITITLKFQ